MSDDIKNQNNEKNSRFAEVNSQENEISIGDVNEAIEKVLKGGQSYKILSRSMTRPDLKELNRMKAEMYAGQEAENGLIDRTVVARFDGR